MRVGCLDGRRERAPVIGRRLAHERLQALRLRVLQRCAQLQAKPTKLRLVMHLFRSQK